jgi:glycosyltransferase involved in cell wall biosynthesis
MKSLNVLIVAESPFSHQNGYGYALHSLFSTWDPENLFQICPVSTYSSVQPSKGASVGLAWLLGIHAGGKINLLKYLFGFRAGWNGKYSKLWISRVLGNWQPDLVYSFANSVGTLEYAYWASTLYKIPFVAHITDNIPIENNNNSKKALINAKSVLCSTLDHAEFLSSVLHRTCNYLPPIGCSQPSLEEPESKSRVEKKSFLFVYLGTVHSPDYNDTNYWSLKDICHAVISLAKDGHRCRLGIYGSAADPAYAKALVDGDYVYYGGIPSKEEGQGLMKEADCLLIPLSFNPQAVEAMKYCYSSKLPDSLASGTPTLVYAPPEAAISRICVENNIGFLVTEQSQVAIKTMLKYLVYNTEAAFACAKVHARYAISHMSSESLSNRLKEILCHEY